jgi:hypothetical protein
MEMKRRCVTSLKLLLQQFFSIPEEGNVIHQFSSELGRHAE